MEANGGFDERFVAMENPDVIESSEIEVTPVM